MKILAVSDIHSDKYRAEKLRQKIDTIKPDLVVIGGDVATLGESESQQQKNASEILDVINTGSKMIAVTGNHDLESVREEFEKRGILAHNKAVDIDGIGFMGFKGPEATRIGGLYVLNYENIEDVVKDFREFEKRVIISHEPPLKTKVDKMFTGSHVGNEFLRDVIEDEQPDLVLCGHIHEGKGIDKIGRTTIVNTGALCEGYAALIYLADGEPKVSLFNVHKENEE